eukprot:437332_1
MSFPRLIDYSVGTLYIDKVVVSIALIHNACLFLKVLYDNQKSTELPTSSQFRNVLYYITISTVASFFIFNCTQIFAVFEFVFDSYGCKNITITGTVTYYFSIYLSWIFSLTRLKIVFHKKTVTFATVGYSSCFIHTFAILVTLNVIILILLTVFTVNSNVASISNGMRYCDIPSGGNPLVGFAFSTLNVAPTITCFWLFYRKMRLLEVNIFKAPKMSVKKSITQQASPTPGSSTNKNTVSVMIHGLDDMDSTNDRKETDNDPNNGQVSAGDYDLVYVVRKYAVLSAASIISSWAGLFLILCSSLSFAAISLDTIVNCWCIVLFDKRYDRIYHTIFGCVSVAKKIKLHRIQSEMSMQSMSNTNGSGQSSHQP